MSSPRSEHTLDHALITQIANNQVSGLVIDSIMIGDATPADFCAAFHAACEANTSINYFYFLGNAGELPAIFNIIAQSHMNLDTLAFDNVSVRLMSLVSACIANFPQLTNIGINDCNEAVTKMLMAAILNQPAINHLIFGRNYTHNAIAAAMANMPENIEYFSILSLTDERQLSAMYQTACEAEILLHRSQGLPSAWEQKFAALNTALHQLWNIRLNAETSNDEDNSVTSESSDGMDESEQSSTVGETESLVTAETSGSSSSGLSPIPNENAFDDGMANDQDRILSPVMHDSPSLLSTAFYPLLEFTNFGDDIGIFESPEQRERRQEAAEDAEMKEIQIAVMRGAVFYNNDMIEVSIARFNLWEEKRSQSHASQPAVQASSQFRFG